MKTETLVSVVVPTFNSEKTLAICLQSVKAQSYSNIEVVIVDNYSTDMTRDIAEKFGARVILCRCLRSKARNVGVSWTKGDFILSMDSDMQLTPSVISECLEVIKNNDEIGCVIIPERSVGDSFWVKVRDFERSFYHTTAIESARFFRASLVKKVNGFDEEIVFFEESTLPQKISELGFCVRARVLAEILHQENNFSLGNWVRKKFYYGKTAHIYKKKYKKYYSKQMNIGNRLLIFIKNERFYSHPLLAFGVITLKLFAAELGFLVSDNQIGYK